MIIRERVKLELPGSITDDNTVQNNIESCTDANNQKSKLEGA